MAVKTNQYIANPLTTTQDTSRGPSANMWGDCPWESMIQMPGSIQDTSGYVTWDDFTTVGFPTLNAHSQMGQWACWSDTGNLAVDPMLEGGVLGQKIVTINKQWVMASEACGYRFASGATNYPLYQKMWFECRVALGSVAATKSDMFIGLCDNTTSQICSAGNLVLATAGGSIITTKGLIGFVWLGGVAQDWTFQYNVNGGTVQTPTGLQTLGATVLGAAPVAMTSTNGVPVANSFIKLGWVYDPNAAPVYITTAATGNQTVGNLARPMIKIYVNGLLAAAFLIVGDIQSVKFPVNFMAPTICSTSTAANAFNYIDWIRVAQLANY